LAISDFTQLAASNDSRDDGHDLEPEATTWDDRHFYVTFSWWSAVKLSLGAS
jgi:hypothetical protein